MQKLQSLLFSKPDICSEEGLYLRSRKQVTYANLSIVSSNLDHTAIILTPDMVISTSTYFNLFPIHYWKTYTNVTEISFKFSFSGKLQFKLIGSIDKAQSANIENIADYAYELSEVDVCELTGNGNELITVFDITKIQSLAFSNLYIEILALNETILYEDGGIYTKSKPIREVNLALVTTTYKREIYVSRNRALMLKYLDNELPLFWYIIDNGQTLIEETTEKLRVLHNKNYGGAGGFGRGLYEAELAKNFTHIMYSDDDVEIEPRIYERVIQFYQYVLSPKTCLGGAMLSQEDQKIQRERYCKFRSNEVCTDSKNVMLDITQLGELLFNNLDNITPISAFAWWFCVFPLELGFNNKYPLPLFFQGDDIEFGLRLNKHNYKLINFNSLGLWHEKVQLKNYIRRYYQRRNSLILTIIYGNYFKAISLIISRTILALLNMTYKTLEIEFLGYKDALKGAEYLMNLDAELKHQELYAHEQDKFIENKNAFEPIKIINKFSIFSLIILCLSFIGNLIPGFFQKKIVLQELYADKSSIMAKLFAKEIYFLDETSQYVMITIRSRMRSVKMLLTCFSLGLTLAIKYKKIKKSYARNYEYMSSRDFWHNYLK